jgi:RNA polymerase sigma-70 factor (ECF subfamily)
MTDAELIALVKCDDPRGLAQIYKDCRQEFVHWLMRQQKLSNDDAREIYQASILILYDNIMADKLDGLRSSIKTYLFGIGKNLVWQRYRALERQQKVSAEFYLKIHLADEAESIELEKNLDLISAGYRQLGEPCSQLLRYYYFERQTMDHICAIMGYKNTETAKNQKYKCMERLRKLVFTQSADAAIENEYID